MKCASMLLLRTTKQTFFVVVAESYHEGIFLPSENYHEGIFFSLRNTMKA